MKDGEKEKGERMKLTCTVKAKVESIITNLFRPKQQAIGLKGTFQLTLMCAIRPSTCELRRRQGIWAWMAPSGSLRPTSGSGTWACLWARVRGIDWRTFQLKVDTPNRTHSIGVLLGGSPSPMRAFASINSSRVWQRIALACVCWWSAMATS